MEKVMAKLEKILQDSANRNCIFRGEDQCYPDVSSNLYRQYGDSGNNVPILEIEREIIEKAQRHIRPNAANIEVLTELQHYGGATSLIDFTQNILIALFFACDGSPKRDGRIVQLNINSVFEEKDISYENELHDIIRIYPTGKGPRVIFQSSVFVRPTAGFIDEKRYKTIKIQKDIKNSLLNYLDENFNISRDTIYNDMQGFIRNQERYSPSVIESYLAERDENKIKEGVCPKTKEQN